MRAFPLHSILGAAWIGIASLVGVPPVADASSSDLSNAAPLYRQSFEKLPELQEEEKQLTKKVIQERKVAPSDRAAVENLLKRMGPSLQLSAQAVQASRCDWELDFSKGMAMSVPHLQDGLNVVRHLMLQAITQWERGAMDAGVQSWCVAVEMGRHLGNDPLLISRLVQNSTRNMAIQTIAPLLLALDKASLKRVEHCLRPLEQDMQEIIQNDISMTATFWRDLRDRQSQVKKGGEKEIMPEVAQFLKEHPGITNADQFVAFERDLKQFLSLLSLPQNEAIPRVNAFMESIPPTALISHCTFPAFNGVLDKDRQAEVEAAMVRSAVAIREKGEGALESVRDPSDGQPFQYTAWKGGFKLESRLKHRKEPIAITFGTPKA